MKKRIKFLTVATAIAVACSVTVYAAYDSTKDPIVSLSYLTDVFKPAVKSELKSELDATVKTAKDTLSSQIKTEISNAKSSLLSEISSQISSSKNSLASEINKQLSSAKSSLSTEINTQLSSVKTSLSTEINTQLSSAKNSLSADINTQLSSAKTTLSNEVKTGMASVREDLEEKIDQEYSATIESMQEKLEALTNVYEVVTIEKGRKLTVSAACEIVLVSGSATVRSSAANSGIIDCTDGVILYDGQNVPANHKLLVPDNGDGRGLTCTGTAQLLVKGGYSVG